MHPSFVSPSGPSDHNNLKLIKKHLGGHSLAPGAHMKRFLLGPERRRDDTAIFHEEDFPLDRKNLWANIRSRLEKTTNFVPS